MTDETEKSTSNVWQRIKASLGLQYGMPFIDGPDEPEETQLDLFPPPFPCPPFDAVAAGVSPFIDLSTAEIAFDFGYAPAETLSTFEGRPPFLDLKAHHVLPQSTLEQLVMHGELMSVTTFDEHMNPDVHWIAPAEFGAAFDDLVRGEKIMTEAAYTELKPAFPGYVNLQLSTSPTSADPLAQREGEHDLVVVTLRGSPIEGRNGDGHPTITAAPTTVLTLPIEAWDQLMTGFNRMRAGEPQRADGQEPMPMGKPE